jgi:hypothetical protein
MNVVEVKQLLNGPSLVILAVYMKSDGATGELVNHTLLDPVVDLGLKSKHRLRLLQLLHNFAGFDAVISFDKGGVDPNWKWVLSEGTNHPVDFRPFGNIKDDSGLDGNGKLQISTTGFTSSTDQGSLLMVLKK